MARLTLHLDPDTYQHLVRQALRERRPIDWAALRLLREALGLPGIPTDEPDGAGVGAPEVAPSDGPAP